MCIVASQLCSYEMTHRCSKAVIWCVVCSHKIQYMSFVVMCSCAPNSNVYKSLQYMHTMLYQRMTKCMSRAVALQSDLSCNSNLHKEFLR